MENVLFDMLRTYLTPELYESFQMADSHFKDYSQMNIKSKRLTSIYNIAINHVSILKSSTHIDFDVYFTARYKTVVRVNELNLPPITLDSFTRALIQDQFQAVLDELEETTLLQKRKQHAKPEDGVSASDGVVIRDRETSTLKGLTWGKLTPEQRKEAVTTFAKKHVESTLLAHKHIADDMFEQVVQRLISTCECVHDSVYTNIKWNKDKGMITQVTGLLFKSESLLCNDKFQWELTKQKRNASSNRLSDKHTKVINDIVIEELAKGSSKSETIDSVKRRLKFTRLSPTDRKKIHTSYEKIKAILK